MLISCPLWNSALGHIAESIIFIKIINLGLLLLMVVPHFTITSNCGVHKINLCHQVDHYFVNEGAWEHRSHETFRNSFTLCQNNSNRKFHFLP